MSLLMTETHSGRPNTPEHAAAPGTDPSTSVIPAVVSVFYSHPFGQCWGGLTIDSSDNLYPVNTAGVYKILSNGTLVNGVNDTNLFTTGTATDSVALDDNGGMFYSTGEVGYPYTIGGPFYVSAAPFSAGSSFAPLINGLGGPGNVVLGQGPTQKTLFVAEIWQNKIARASLSTLKLTEFGNASIFQAPSAIASTPDGSVYVSSLNVDRYGNSLGNIFLTKIAPDGTVSRFINGSAPAPNLDDVLAVDKTGNIYWGNALGINKYNSNGNLLGTLPGPPDRQSLSFILGGVFDSKGNLYLVDNDGCQAIYKYTFLPVLELESFYLGVPFAGRYTLLVNSFTNLGNDTDQIIRTSITSDFGSWSLPGVPFELVSGDNRIVNVSIAIPSTAYEGNHTLTFTTYWKYYSGLPGAWTDAPILTFSGNLPVQSSTPPPSQPSTKSKPSNSTLTWPSLLLSLLSKVGPILYPAIAVYFSLCLLTTFIVVRHGNTRARSAGQNTYCQRCGMRSSPQDRFCGNCGTQLDQRSFTSLP
jgi:hypothetical protein